MAIQRDVDRCRAERERGTSPDRLGRAGGSLHEIDMTALDRRTLLHIVAGGAARLTSGAVVPGAAWSWERRMPLATRGNSSISRRQSAE